jgi:hypothetical protein
VKARVVGRSLALLLLVTAASLFGGSLGCDLLLNPPAPPKVPDLKAPEPPQPPEMPKPPDVKAPPAPQVPSAPVPGNCCLRDPGQAATACGGGAQRCCTDKYDRSDCEDAGGFWFHTPEGCAGAC